MGPFLFAASAGEFGGSGFRLTGEEALGGCFPKDKKDEMLRLVGKIGRVVGAGLGGEEREDFLGGKGEESILLDCSDGAIDHSLVDIPFDADLEALTSHRSIVLEVDSTGDEKSAGTREVQQPKLAHWRMPR